MGATLIFCSVLFYIIQKNASHDIAFMIHSWVTTVVCRTLAQRVLWRLCTFPRGLGEYDLGHHPLAPSHTQVRSLIQLSSLSVKMWRKRNPGSKEEGRKSVHYSQ